MTAQTTQIKQIKQIKQVAHRAPGAGPAGLPPALEGAGELHAPVRRAPEAVPEAAPATIRRRTASGRGRRTARG
ncbi:hypothetical protein [Streptomyces sp. KMM 9044]|uniref:hypothetical protein n=1 Tax=Streptomyces sp. KMM 9044 TaxID=2744474 RepID=UPI00215082BB|nr:hypothetical protein [Streptomyces sp. KMM 9044]WAX79294.1 hypothetical protein HUV60_018130 [Streptomyces sp. KMM 9044]